MAGFSRKNRRSGLGFQEEDLIPIKTSRVTLFARADGGTGENGPDQIVMKFCTGVVVPTSSPTLILVTIGLGVLGGAGVKFLPFH